VDTLIAIARNSAIIVASIAVFAGIFVFASTWLSDNSHEPHDHH